MYEDLISTEEDINRQIQKIINQIKSDIISVNFSKKFNTRDYCRTNNIFLYYRVTKHYIEGNYVDTIDIASIEIVPECMRGKGFFTKLLQEIEKLAIEYDRIIYIESVVSDRLFYHLSNLGYQQSDYNFYNFRKENNNCKISN